MRRYLPHDAPATRCAPSNCSAWPSLVIPMRCTGHVCFRRKEFRLPGEGGARVPPWTVLVEKCRTDYPVRTVSSSVRPISLRSCSWSMVRWSPGLRSQVR